MKAALVAPFPYFGGKARACEPVWRAFGDVDNYVEPFAGSAAMLLGAPNRKRVETINDADGFVSNFWRAVAADADAVADAADWPTNETDLFARHSWLVRQAADLTERLHADPAFYDARIAGWWCWGSCNWIGSGWCSGEGPWTHDGEKLVNAGDAGRGINRQLPHLGDAGQGINRKLPHLGNAGRGINRQLPHLGDAGQGIGVNRQIPALSGGNGFIGRGLQRATDLPRGQFIREWMADLHARLRDVRVACGDWSRVLTESVTTRHGLTGVFLDPPYTKGEMDYTAGGVGGDLANAVRSWCLHAGHDRNLRVVLCGHAGEHDALLSAGWDARKWTARKGYALTDEALSNSAGETIWCSPHCEPERLVTRDLFASVESEAA